MVPASTIYSEADLNLVTPSTIYSVAHQNMLTASTICSDADPNMVTASTIFSKNYLSMAYDAEERYHVFFLASDDFNEDGVMAFDGLMTYRRLVPLFKT